MFTGISFVTFQPGEQEAAELVPAVHDDEQGTTDSAQDSSQSSSYLLMEVASGDGTCRYVIQAPGLLEEGGASSTTVAQDIANLLLAAEQVYIIFMYSRIN